MLRHMVSAAWLLPGPYRLFYLFLRSFEFCSICYGWAGFRVSGVFDLGLSSGVGQISARITEFESKEPGKGHVSTRRGPEIYAYESWEKVGKSRKKLLRNLVSTAWLLPGPYELFYLFLYFFCFVRFVLVWPVFVPSAFLISVYRMELAELAHE